MTALFVTTALLLLALNAYASIIGIDLGSQYIKAVAVKQSKFFTVLDEASRRKSLSLVAFDDDQRVIGNAAETTALQRPQAAFMWAHRLLGKPFGCELQEQLVNASYPYTFSETSRGTIALELDQKLYSVEELVAMQLRTLQNMAFEQSGSPTGHTVITVPPYFTQVERQAVLDAAAIADIKVVSLINDNTAAAIQYGLDRAYSLNETHTACIFNVGASSTTATVVKYSAYGIKNGLVSIPTGQLEVLGNGFDDNLGGNLFDVRLTSYLADRFQEQLDKAGVQLNVQRSLRVMARLRGAARVTKEVLTTNQESVVRVANLYLDIDFKTIVTRDTFHNICSDLFSRVSPVVTRALDDAKSSAGDVDAFILVGGSSRIPRIQAILTDATGGKALHKGLNSDEAIAFGAAFHAANNSISFQVRNFGCVDKLQYPVGLRMTELQGQNGQEPRTKRASIYSKHARLGSQRHIEIPWESDIRVELQYDDKVLPTCTNPKIVQYEVTGISKACAEYKKHGTPLAKLVFDLTMDGIVQLASGEVSVTYTEMEPVPRTSLQSKNESGDSESEPEMRSVTKTLQMPVTFKEISLGGMHVMGDEGRITSKAFLDALDKQDQYKRDLATARNLLEEHIYGTRSKLTEEVMQKFSKPETLEHILESLKAAENWLEDNFDSKDISVFKGKFAELELLSKDVFFRQKQARLRANALSALDTAVSNASKSLKKISTKMDWIPKELIDIHEKFISEASEWLAIKRSEDKDMDLTENPKFLASEIVEKKKELNERIALLQKIPKPIAKPAEKKTAADSATTATSAESAGKKSRESPDPNLSQESPAEPAQESSTQPTEESVNKPVEASDSPTDFSSSKEDAADSTGKHEL